MTNRLDTFRLDSFPSKEQIEVGWSQFSIVPQYPMHMAGYKPRDIFTEVHDTVYMRIMALSNGATTVYLVSADLLLFPPALKLAINKSENEFVFYSATHTHTSVGGWEPSILGNILMGDYDQRWIDEIASKTLEHMQHAKQEMLPSQLNYWEVDADEYVGNRIDPSAPIDGKLRGISIARSDSTKALFFTFGAHATLIAKQLTALSADYPGEVIKQLAPNYDFTLFMAGMVGSHRFKGFETKQNFELTAAVGKLLSSFISNAEMQPLPNELTIQTGHLKVEHGPSQLRLFDHIKLRDWVFRAISQPLEGEITVLKIGNVLMLGTACDFSGEIFTVEGFGKLAEENDAHLIITSFNGDYTGYITEDTHYHTSDDEEVHILNWVGPYFGQYYAAIIKSVLEITSD